MYMLDKYHGVQHFAGWLSEADGMSMSLKQLLLHILIRKDVV